MLIRAAKKHHIEVRYSFYNIPVTRHEAAIRVPNIHILFMPEMNSGTSVTRR
jgi:hypothetical protein